MRPLYRVVLGTGLGVVLGVVSVTLGPFGEIVAVALVIAVGLLMRELGAIGGGLVGLGVTWLVLTFNSQRICAGTEDFCGNANFAPWFVGGFAVAIVGAAVTVWALAGKHGSRPPPSIGT